MARFKRKSLTPRKQIHVEQSSRPAKGVGDESIKVTAFAQETNVAASLEVKVHSFDDLTANLQAETEEKIYHVLR